MPVKLFWEMVDAWKDKELRETTLLGLGLGLALAAAILLLTQ